uniref:DUF233 protein n=1 Tax=Heliothis virescens TaxID=7102 RepID=A0A2A4J606_HELVI
MFKSQCLLLCLCFVASSFGNVAPFIDKCEWSDKPCLVKSSQKAVPFVAAGLKEIGLPPLDPLKMSKATLQEGELKIEFEDMTVIGSSKCKVVKVERNIDESSLVFEAECPIKVEGTYTGSGKILFAPFEGHGAFEVQTNKIFISINAQVKTVTGADGVEHWQIGKVEKSYECIEKATFKFENLFNGDKSKADPILVIFDQSWKELMASVAKPIVNAIIDEYISVIKIFADKVPRNELE